MTEIEMLQPLHHAGTQEIKTERLLLRPFRRTDYRDMFVWAGNAEVVRYLSYAPHQTIKTSKKITREWVRSYRNPSSYNWAITYQGTVIGSINVVGQDDPSFACAMGWQIDIPYWNQGIMTEAARAVFDFLFGTVGYERITACHDARNVGSGRVMQKSGMLHEGTLRRFYFQKDGSIGDRECYAILKSDWQKQKQQPGAIHATVSQSSS